MDTTAPTSTTEQPGHFPVECPHCKKTFWHNVKAALVQIAELPINIIANSTNLGGDS
jgi:hypothetical protein